MHLLIGIRNDMSDFIYKTEIMETIELLRSHGGCDARLYIACSRHISTFSYPDWVTTKHGYVQEYLKETELIATIKDLTLDKKGYIMICGNKNTLGKAVLEHLQQPNFFTEGEIQDLKKEERLLVELWHE